MSPCDCMTITYGESEQQAAAEFLKNLAALAKTPEPVKATEAELRAKLADLKAEVAALKQTGPYEGGAATVLANDPAYTEQEEQK